MSRLSLCALVLGLAALAIPAPLPAAAAGWRVELSLELDGEPVGRPVLALRSGEPASVELAGGSAPYRIEARLDEAAGAPGEVYLGLRLWRGDATGAWHAAGEPRLRVAPGQAFAIGLAGADGGGYRLSGTVAPLPARD